AFVVGLEDEAPPVRRPVGLGVLTSERQLTDVGEKLLFTRKEEGGRARRGGGSRDGWRPDRRSAGAGRAEEEEAQPEREDSQSFAGNPRKTRRLPGRDDDRALDDDLDAPVLRFARRRGVRGDRTRF